LNKQWLGGVGACVVLTIVVGCREKPETPPTPKSPEVEQPAEATKKISKAHKLHDPDNQQVLDPFGEERTYFPPGEEFRLERAAAEKAALKRQTIDRGKRIPLPAPIPPAPDEVPTTEVAVAPKKPAFDPVKKNGPIFEGWAAPKVAILITGEQLGYIEPCGCAGLENQKGGLSRRHTLLKQLQEKSWPVVAVDLGGLVNRFGKQAEIKFQNAVDALKIMNYAAIGWGPSDLRLPAGELVSAITDTDVPPSRFVSANVALFGFEAGLTAKFRIVEAGGRKIGITSVLGNALQKQVNNSDVTFAEAEKALADVVPQLSKCDYRILLSYASPEESAKLAKRFPEFNLVVTAEGADEPPNEPRKAGDRPIVELGHKGMFAIVLGLYDDAKRPWRYQRVPLDSRFADAVEMRRVMVNYQHQLQELGWEGLGLKPKTHPRASSAGDPSGQFVGSEQCGKCHTKAFDVWKNSPHAHATESLVNAKPPRQFDAECISCHATGWNPQQFFPYASGFVSLEKTPHLKGNGCENCHGPGGAHVAVESASGGNATERDRLRYLMRVQLGTVADNQCAVCHDLDNSPEFDLSSYWSQIEHKGKD
jgi:hypothetical protein